MKSNTIEQSYLAARDKYSEIGVDCDRVLEQVAGISLSLPCWQGDDVRGFESSQDTGQSGGIQVTGHHPGRARNLSQLQQDLKLAFRLIPGKHRLNLHAMYGDFRRRPADRNQIDEEHFSIWVDWARHHGLKLDFNATCFQHAMASSGMTLSSKDPGVREFWIEHVLRCRKISSFIGKQLKSPCLHNLWIPDGAKDITIDRWGYRRILMESLDRIYAVDFPAAEMKDSLESKLFGIGSESFVVGSHEFYLLYCLRQGLIPCFDMGHFHPTETVADKLSATLPFTGEIALHISRGIRWDSDHVVILSDELQELMSELVRGGALDKVCLALDFFDAGLNRVGAWVIGARAVLQAGLRALLEPVDKLKSLEESGGLFERLAILEDLKLFPFGAVWDYYCLREDVPVGPEWREKILAYEKKAASRRD